MGRGVCVVVGAGVGNAVNGEGNMKGLAWYATVLSILFEIMFAIEYLSGTSDNVAVTLWTMVIWAPIAVFGVKYLKSRG